MSGDEKETKVVRQESLSNSFSAVRLSRNGDCGVGFIGHSKHSRGDKAPGIKE